MPAVEQKLEIPMADGRADVFLYRPEEGAAPDVLFLTDIKGIRTANLGMARRIADRGYTVLVPNVFYRVSKLPLFDFELKLGDERTMKRIGELRGGLSNAQMGGDGAAYTDFLLKQDAVSGARIGVVGYCFTGQMALRTAAAASEKIAAAASFHGGGLATDQPDSPHLLLPKIGAALYIGHAIEDRGMPADAIAALDNALKLWSGTFESETYEGAFHGWTVPGRDIYNEKQAERHYVKLFELLDGTLG